VKIDIRPLKKLANQFPRESVLRRLITEEKDELEIDEFVVKVEIYLKLARDLKRT